MLGGGLEAANPSVQAETQLRLGYIFVEVLVLETMVFKGRNGLLDDAEPNDRSPDGLRAAMLALKTPFDGVRPSGQGNEFQNDSL